MAPRVAACADSGPTNIERAAGGAPRSAAEGAAGDEEALLGVGAGGTTVAVDRSMASWIMCPYLRPDHRR